MSARTSRRQRNAATAAAAALVGFSALGTGSVDTALAAGPKTDVVRTLCPNGETPTPNHSGCWCGEGDPAKRMSAAWPDADCSPAERVEGLFCVFTCPHHDPPKPPPPVCHDGLGHHAVCPTDDESVCAVDDYVWRSHGGCDSPPDPADRIYIVTTPAKAPVSTNPAWWRRTAATYEPAPVVGDVFIVFKYLSTDPHIERPAPTSVAVEWGGWTHHGVVSPPPGGHGFVIKLRHRNPDTVKLNVATDGAIVSGPSQGPPPAELTAPGYQTITW